MTTARRTIFIVVLVACAALFVRYRGVNAQISGAPCVGNICTGSVNVGGQTVEFAYTEHIGTNGVFKIRLNGGTYNTGSVISYMIYDMPAFASWSKYKNPAVVPPPGYVYLPEEDVNPTAYERLDSNGCLGCKVDQVMTVTYSGLAPGAHTFSLLIIQNGSSGGFIDRNFYVDAGAPNTDNEAASLAAITPAFNPSCGDSFAGQPVDNDLDYLANCADPSCNNQQATGLGPTPVCELPELTCSDDFDNDADGLKDCQDPDCNGRIGQVSPPAYCQTNESLATLLGTTPCNDLFDNDADGLEDCVDNISSPPGNPAQTCWKQPVYGCPATETSCTDGVDNDRDRSYDDSVANWDDQPSTGIDCMDYDCAGNAACPSVENKNAGGLEVPDQCFDTVDNDLDHQIDCADLDCRGVMDEDTPGHICFEKEFDLAQSYQRCENAGFDDDGDGPADCNDDPDCKRRFGSCGPCPAREDFTYASCSDAQNNDTDAASDCSDIDCIGSLGKPSTAAHCVALGAESGSAACSDAFDNDVNAKTDCADTACVGASICIIPSCGLTYSCQPAGETGAVGCNDTRDNDADGLIDCADNGCYGQGSCLAKGWTNAACQTVPRFSGAQTFTSSSPTVTAQSYEVVHVSSSDVVRLTGTASYSSITIIIGDNTDPTKYYPYASSLGANCLLSGTNAGQFGATAVNGHAIQLFNISQPVNGFDISLNCLTSAVPAAAKSYPISISVQKEPGSVAEYGDAAFATTLYESTVPTMIAIEGEGETFASSTLRVPYGDQRRFRGVPNDPGAGLNQSGICGCTVNVGATPHPSASGECVTGPVVLTNDAAVTVSGLAEDGANNIGPTGGSRALTINVVPSVKTALTMTSPAKPYFKTGASQIGISAEFQTGIPGSFNATCSVYIRNLAGTVVVNGPGGPSMTFAGVTGGGNLLNCLSTVTLPTLSDGEYTLAVRATDVAGDSVESAKLPIFICNSVPGFGAPETVCSKADLDFDGASDGLYTTLYSTSPKSCDNCMGLPNGTQADLNANGIGDQCEPDDAHGRCEVDTNLVCDCDSDAATCTGIKCPGPSIKQNALGDNIDPQRCIENWGLCTTGGSICLDTPGNPADEQCHFCDADPGVGCSVDQDCEDAGLGAGATCGVLAANNGEGTCVGLPALACRRDSQCLDAANDDAYVGPCENSNRCENLLFPWLQTEFGSIFSKKNIIAPAEPPENQFNATYCISAQGTIANFKSENCVLAPSAGTPFDIPKPPSYTNVFGRIDVPGLLAGKYGQVVTVTQATFNATFNANPLDGKVYLIENEDLSINAPISIGHATGAGKGGGTVIVKGGNLTFNANVTYSAVGNPQRLSNIGSIAWLVLPVINPDLTLSKGDIYISKDVSTVVGAFFAGGDEGIYTILPTDIEGPGQLQVFGMMVAKKFHLGRSYKSVSEGSEKFIFDGRAVANPPPGLGDITKTLPLFSDTLPQ